MLIKDRNASRQAMMVHGHHVTGDKDDGSVQFMGHPGSQLADGLHPLGKPQLVFQQISQKKSGSSAITA